MNATKAKQLKKEIGKVATSKVLKAGKPPARSLPLAKDHACVVCGCTQNHACAVKCSWSRVYPDVCSGCASKSPYRANNNGMIRDDREGSGVFENWIVTGPGKYAKSPTSIPMGLQARLSEELAEAIAVALNDAYTLGMKFGDRVGRGS